MFNNLKTGQIVWLRNCIKAPVGQAKVVAVDTDHAHIEAWNGKNYKFTQEDVDANRISTVDPAAMPTPPSIDTTLTELLDKLSAVSDAIYDYIETH